MPPHFVPSQYRMGVPVTIPLAATKSALDRSISPDTTSFDPFVTIGRDAVMLPLEPNESVPASDAFRHRVILPELSMPNFGVPSASCIVKEQDALFRSRVVPCAGPNFTSPEPAGAREMPVLLYGELNTKSVPSNCKLPTVVVLLRKSNVGDCAPVPSRLRTISAVGVA
jgi:hypothetical protein